MLIRTGVAALAMMATVAHADAPAATPQPSCPAHAAPLPAELAPWSAQSALTAASGSAGADRARIEPGLAITGTLLPVSELRLPANPGKVGASGSFGGVFAVKIPGPGTYRVALGSAAWVDVVRDGKAVTSTAHGHGPVCSGIRKIVDFNLSPGDYLVQISAAENAAMPMMVVRKL